MYSLKLLNLQLAQAEALLFKAKHNKYSDKNKQTYHNKLEELFLAIKSSLADNMPKAKIFEKKNHLDFLFKSFAFLKDSTLNAIPYEVVECLNLAMSDWVRNDDFIIVTSLQNEFYSFSYDLSYAKNDLFYKSLETEYGISFGKKLVQINLPSVVSKDYLATVVLYHELGHFVDLQYDISTIATQIAINHLSIDQKKSLESYLPFSHDTNIEQILYYHLGEYFSDLFAAQYVGDSLSHFLNYVTAESTKHNISHPSTPNRIEVVEDFVRNRSNPIIDLLNIVTDKRANNKLYIRFKEIRSDDFFNLIPYVIKQDSELHGILHYGWSIWLNGLEELKERQPQVNSNNAHSVVNNLIEKSIGNYIVTKNWNQAKAEWVT